MPQMIRMWKRARVGFRSDRQSFPLNLFRRLVSYQLCFSCLDYILRLALLNTFIGSPTLLNHQSIPFCTWLHRQLPERLRSWP